MRFLAVAAVAVLALCGCSGNNDSTATETAPSPTSESDSLVMEAVPQPGDERALRRAVKAYSDAFLTGRGDAAFELLTHRCRRELGRDRFTGLVERAGDLYGSRLELKSFEAEFMGDLASVTYTFDISALNQADEAWAFDYGFELDGAWRNDQC